MRRSPAIRTREASSRCDNASRSTRATPAEGRSAAIKIDVEGAEEEALLGGPRALADRETLRTVIVECAGGPRPGPRERSAAVVRILRAAGFELRTLDPNGSSRPWAEADLDRSVYLLARR